MKSKRSTTQTKPQPTSTKLPGWPRKKFEIIYADPPWAYRDKAAAGNRGASFKYPTQSKTWVEDLPVGDIAADDCALFLWVTMPMIPNVAEIMKRWGFKYKTAAFVWVKTNKNSGTPFWGMGNWTRANAEICLLATKGKPKRASAKVHQIIHAPMIGHSAKPTEVRDRIVELLGDRPRIELFARPPKPKGWATWGNEI